MIQSKQKTFFRNKVVTKKYLTEILFWTFKNYGIARAGFLADSLKKLGFYFATEAGISISIEDLKVPRIKNSYIEKTNRENEKAEFEFTSGKINEVERYQQITDNWNMTSEKLKDQIVNFLKNSDPLNPIYMMAFSGARGNLSQVRQLIGIRGLMAGPSGNILDIPITKNFREGLSTTDYMISAYGARKGLVDTALKTADSGYLTRRLIDVAQDILIRERECFTKKGIYLFQLDNKKGKIIRLKDRIVGRILAKDVIDPISKKIIGRKNQQIDSLVAREIEQHNLESVVVRSPLTCELSRSICKNCYGSNLSNGKLVDLGEAIGIIAAQSIGEPGTQLTMRTFHTGGIFSADSNYQIFSKLAGRVVFPTSLKTFLIRTVQGKNALLIEFSTNLKVINFKNKVNKIFIKKDTLLFVKNHEFIKKDQLIGVLSENFRNLEEKRKKILFSKISGEIIFNKKRNANNSNLNSNLLLRMHNHLVWILFGKVFNIPFCTKITKYKYSKLSILSNIASSKLLSYRSGRIKILNDYEINLLIKNFSLKNCKLYNVSNKNILANKKYKHLIIIRLNENKFFHLSKELKFNVKKFLSIGQLINAKFKTKISGIPYFLKLKPNVINRKSKIYNLEQGGGIFYLPEETFVVNQDSSSILVKNNKWVESNTKLAENIYNKTSGFVSLVLTNNIVNKIIIKSGYCVKIKSKQMDIGLDKKLFFKGEKVFDMYEIKQPTYTEIIKSSRTIYLLFRPIFLYELPKAKLEINSNKFIEFNYTDFKTKDRIILGNNNSISLIKTDLRFINNNLKDFTAELNFNKIKKNNFSLQCNIFENIYSKNDSPKNIDSRKLSISVFVKNNQYIEPYTVIGNVEFLPNLVGKINILKEKKKSKFRRILITLPDDYKTIFSENKTILSKNFINKGEFLTNNLITVDSGIIEKTKFNQLKIRLAKPFLFSQGAESFWSHNDFIKQNEPLGLLFYKRAQTGDMVQGLPKIEEILEARQPKNYIPISDNPGLVLNTLKKELDFSYISRFGVNLYRLAEEDSSYKKYQDKYIYNEFFLNIGEGIKSNKINAHNRLKYLNFYYKKFLNPYQAASRSLKKIQSCILNTIQEIYSSQGVLIADKHLEVIIKQMTSKIRVKNRGDSGILNGEYVDLEQTFKINKILKKTNSKEMLYEPTLLGITKASLRNESFISASSFQETVRILTNAAIQGKVDWLRGLKENVIVGRLIPVGTGFNKYDQISDLGMIKRVK